MTRMFLKSKKLPIIKILIVFILISKYIFRLGLDYRNANISNGILMTEFGYSLGISYKFKALSNQIDFIYFGGGRSYESNFNEETFQQLQVGVTIADLWFVKRRQRRNE